MSFISLRVTRHRSGLLRAGVDLINNRDAFISVTECYCRRCRGRCLFGIISHGNVSIDYGFVYNIAKIGMFFFALSHSCESLTSGTVLNHGDHHVVLTLVRSIYVVTIIATKIFRDWGKFTILAKQSAGSHLMRLLYTPSCGPVCWGHRLLKLASGRRCRMLHPWWQGMSCGEGERAGVTSQVIPKIIYDAQSKIK